MTDIRKAVARALCSDAGYDFDAENDPLRSSNGCDDGQSYWLDQADTAIAAHIDAIMVPSKSVIDAGITAAEDWTTDTNEMYRCDSSSNLPLPVWQAMLTAMRNEK